MPSPFAQTPAGQESSPAHAKRRGLKFVSPWHLERVTYAGGCHARRFYTSTAERSWGLSFKDRGDHQWATGETRLWVTVHQSLHWLRLWRLESQAAVVFRLADPNRDKTGASSTISSLGTFHVCIRQLFFFIMPIPLAFLRLH